MPGRPAAHDCTFAGLLRSKSAERSLRPATDDVYPRWPAGRNDGAGCGIGCQMGRRCMLLVLLSLFLLSTCLCTAAIAEPAPAPPQTGTVTVNEYIAELDGLASTAKQLVHPEDVPKLLNSIPPVWRIQTAERTFEVSSEWLRQELNDWQKGPSHEIHDRIVARLQILRAETASFQDSPKDVSQKRVLLNGILAGGEFQNIHGPTWL